MEVLNRQIAVAAIDVCHRRKFHRAVVAILIVLATSWFGAAQRLAAQPPVSGTASATTAQLLDADLPLATSAAESASPAAVRELASALRRASVAPPLPVRDAPPWLQDIVQAVVRENIPDRYVDDKKWGMQDRRFDGISVSREGLRIATKRKWKEVNHGDWRRYEITQIDPQQNLHVRIGDVHDTGDGRLAMQFTLASRLHAFARVARWNRGVQLYSFSVDADADLQLRIWCELGMKLDLQHLPPDLVLEPVVTRAELEIVDYDVRQISKLHGSLARELGKSLERIVRDKVDDRRHRLPEKLNRQIAKHADDLRFSPSQLVANEWQRLIGAKNNDFVPAGASSRSDPGASVLPGRPASGDESQENLLDLNAPAN